MLRSCVAKTGIPVDDEHEPMTNHAEQDEENVRFNTAGDVIQGQQVAQLLRAIPMKAATAR